MSWKPEAGESDYNVFDEMRWAFNVESKQVPVLNSENAFGYETDDSGRMKPVTPSDHTDDLGFLDATENFDIGLPFLESPAVPSEHAFPPGVPKDGTPHDLPDGVTPSPMPPSSAGQYWDPFTKAPANFSSPGYPHSAPQSQQQSMPASTPLVAARDMRFAQGGPLAQSHFAQGAQPASFAPPQVTLPPKVPLIQPRPRVMPGRRYSTSKGTKDLVLLPIESAHDDKRVFRLTMLPNGMELLIVNETLNKGTVALSVTGGSADDPPEFPGLAQFVQRMVTCGSKRFPGPKMHREYFLSKNESSAGAITMPELTVHTIQVVNQFMRAGLERLMRSVTEALFPLEAMREELRAMDEAFERNCSSETVRYAQLENHIMGLPITQFGTSRSLLAEHTEQELIDAARAFYHEHYQPSRMKMLLYATQKIDMVEKWIEFLWANLEDPANGRTHPPHSSSVSKLAFETPPRAFKTPFNGTLVQMQGKESILVVAFAVPDQRLLYVTNPLAYYGYVLEMDEPSSFLHRLKTMELVESLECSYEHKMEGVDMFKVEMALTDKGNILWDHVAGFLFVYLDQLAEVEPSSRAFDQMVEDMTQAFNKRKLSAYDEAVATVEIMQLPVQRERLLNFNIPSEFNRKIIRTAAKYLQFNNAFITHVAEEHGEYDSAEPIMDVRYNVRQLALERDVNTAKVIFV